MKKLFVTAIVMFVALQGSAQILFQSSTLLESSVITLNADSNNFSGLDQTSFDQTIWWRNRYNRAKHEKMSNTFLSLYKRNDMIGARIYGADLDLMAEEFESSRANTFRLWNKLRLGFALLVEKDPSIAPLPWDESYGYLDGEIYFRYAHIPHSGRGDKRTKYRRGSFEAFFLLTAQKRASAYIKAKPIGSTWLKVYYRQEHKIQQAGLCLEVEAHSDGYGHIRYGSSKDVYRGFTFIGGPELDLHTSKISLRFGVKWDFRNY